jgi:AraC-like DNA-binding protein
MSVRPAKRDARIDVLGDVLQTVRMTNLIYGRFELGTPWALRVPALGHLSFYVVSQNGAWLEVEGAAKPLALSAGDVVFLPHGPAHTLRDVTRRPVAAHELGAAECKNAPAASGGTVRLGGDGPLTTLVSGCFRSSSNVYNPIFAALPPVIHLPAGDAHASPWVAATVQLILAESQAPGLASAVVLARLVDVLLIQALRVQAATPACKQHGLPALRDPSVGAALELMHASLARRWTVEELAQAVGQSRSGFAARFHELVGDPPLQYLARWRMNKAAELLRDSDHSLAEVAERVGYDSGPAFNKAFKRWQGEGPGAYRKRARTPARAP